MIKNRAESIARRKHVGLRARERQTYILQGSTKANDIKTPPAFATVIYLVIGSGHAILGL
jgi:hypothetical protein